VGLEDYQQGVGLDVLTVGAVQMHRMYHSFLRGGMREAERAELSRIACRVLASADPRSAAEPSNWPRYAQLLPHLEPSGALESEDADVRELVLNCVEYLKTRGEYVTGLLLRAKNGLAGTLTALGEYEEARALFAQGAHPVPASPGTALLGLRPQPV
jgi:hypothetical protein